jgi:hypothetical protein
MYMHVYIFDIKYQEPLIGIYLCLQADRHPPAPEQVEKSLRDEFYEQLERRRQNKKDRYVDAVSNRYVHAYCTSKY